MFSAPYFYELKDFLEYKFRQYNTPEYINTDPIQIPWMFDDPRDIEVSAFLTSAIAWGLRKTIVKNAASLMNLMDNDPYQFIMNAGEKDLRYLADFKHRTFNGQDCMFFCKSLKNIYSNHQGLESLFSNKNSIKTNIKNLYKVFFEIPHPERTKKHIANIQKGSAAKRINMFLRWMVRKDGVVDFGLWQNIHPRELYIPLDVHAGRIARKLGLLKRKQNDWQAVEELTNTLLKFEPDDPVKYDYALFGTGVFEKL